MMSHLGIDVGGTKVALRLEAAGRDTVEQTVAWPAPAGPLRADIEVLGDAIARVTTGWGTRIDGAGIAMPATVDRSGHVVAWPNRPSWTGLDLAATLAGLLPGTPVRWADDGDLAGLAEAHAAGLSDIVYLGVGTGIGGAIVANGVSSLEAGRGSVELGHIVIDRTGPRCGCGRRGCLQAVASGPATLSRAAEMRGGPVGYPDLRDAWEARRTWAVAAVTETCDALGAAAASLGEILHPDAIVIGGGFAAGLPGFAGTVAERSALWSRSGHPAPPVRAALLGGLSSLHGAVHLARLATV